MIDTGLIDKELMDYYRELSPAERKLRLEAFENQDEKVTEFCRELYKRRHTDPKHPEKTVDFLLWKLAYLPGLYAKKWLFGGQVKREAAATVEELGLENPDKYSDIEQTLIYLEFRNAAKRYLSTCESDGYANGFFGLKKSTPEDKKVKAAEDIWSSSRWLAIRSGETDRLEIWCLALRDELFQYDKTCEIYYGELEKKAGY